MMPVGIRLFKQTDNLSKSEPRLTSDWEGGFTPNQFFEVPLHDDTDQQYRTVRTGLVRIPMPPTGATLPSRGLKPTTGRASTRD